MDTIIIIIIVTIMLIMIAKYSRNNSIVLINVWICSQCYRTEG